MTTDTQNNTFNTIIRNVQFYWVKVNPTKPVENYAGDGFEWTVQLRFDKSREEEMTALNLGKVNVCKDDANMRQLNLRKKSTKADGNPAKPVDVVDAFKMPLDPTVIGNGSEGNVIVMQKNYEIKNPKTGKVTKSGVSTTLTKVQVTKLVKFEGSNKSFVDFDEETPTANTVTTEEADF